MSGSHGVPKPRLVVARGLADGSRGDSGNLPPIWVMEGRKEGRQLLYCWSFHSKFLLPTKKGQRGRWGFEWSCLSMSHTDALVAAPTAVTAGRTGSFALNKIYGFLQCFRKMSDLSQLPSTSTSTRQKVDTKLGKTLVEQIRKM